MTLFWPILDPFPLVSFGDTGSDLPPGVMLEFSFYRKQLFKDFCGEILLKNGQKMKLDILVEPPHFW